MLLSIPPRLLGLLIILPMVGCAPSTPGSPAGVAASASTRPSAVLPRTPPPVVTAKCSIVIDAITGRILAAKEPDRRRAVASTQKLMTALLTVEAGGLDRVMTIAPADTRVEPTKLYLKTGETYPAAQLAEGHHGQERE